MISRNTTAFFLYIYLYFYVSTDSVCLDRNSTYRRLEEANCDVTAKSNYASYFSGMRNIYHGKMAEGTCLPIFEACGWPRSKSSLPLLVLSVGLEGAGHHLWTELLDFPVFDCVWINGRHYQRDIGDGVPRTTVEHLAEGLGEQLKIRLQTGKKPCQRIFDGEDSFPTGAIRKSGRVFMRPDIINLQKLDGTMFDIKYFLIVRNVTDTALSALRRNFFSNVDSELRTVEHTLTYVEAAMRGIPCQKTFIAHYEHVFADPNAFLEPLSAFLQLEGPAKKQLSERLSQRKRKVPRRKRHKLTQYSECADLSEEKCYNTLVARLDHFFSVRGFMWPTFAGNGFDYNKYS